MTFQQSVRLCLGPGYFFRFTGRASRSEYWWFMFFILLVNCACSIFFIFPLNIAAALNLIVSLALLPASLGVSVRRLHDRGLSGWWLLLPVAMYFAWFFGGDATPIVSLLSLGMCVGYLAIFCMPGTPGPNRFGPAPASYA